MHSPQFGLFCCFALFRPPFAAAIKLPLFDCRQDCFCRFCIIAGFAQFCRAIYSPAFAVLHYICPPGPPPLLRISTPSHAIADSPPVLPAAPGCAGFSPAAIYTPIPARFAAASRLPPPHLIGIALLAYCVCRGRPPLAFRSRAPPWAAPGGGGQRAGLPVAGISQRRRLGRHRPGHSPGTIPAFGLGSASPGGRRRPAGHRAWAGPGRQVLPGRPLPGWPGAIRSLLTRPVFRFAASTRHYLLI